MPEFLTLLVTVLYPKSDNKYRFSVQFNYCDEDWHVEVNGQWLLDTDFLKKYIKDKWWTEVTVINVEEIDNHIDMTEKRDQTETGG